MSTLSQNHSFVVFDAKSSKALDSQRLVKILYKSPKTAGEQKKQSMCVSVPFLNEALNDEQLQKLMPHILNMMENAQDAICKNVYESGAIAVSSDDLCVDAVIAYLDEEAQGDRLTKEKVAEWFVDSGLRDSLAVAFANKLGFPDNMSEAQEKKLNQALAVYADKFASMAGGKTSFAPDVAEKLQAALSVIDVDEAGTIGARFSVRLNKMIAAAGKEDMMLAL